MTRRPRGTGTIEAGRGGFVARLPGRGKRLPPTPTREEAERLLAAAVVQLRAGLVSGDERLTLAAYGRSIIDQREREGARDTGTERSRWRVHVESTPLGRLPLVDVKQADVLRWRDQLLVKRHAARPGRKSTRATIKRSTAANAINLLHVVFRSAVDRGLVRVDPSQEVRLPRSKGSTEKTWDFLTLDEQARLLAAISGPERDLVEVAMRTGLRASELAWLHMEDIELSRSPPRLVVRRSRKGGPPKNGKVRYVPLTPEAVAALRRWLARPARTTAATRRRTSLDVPSSLAFPTARGARRQAGHMLGKCTIDGRRVDRWTVISTATIGRRIRWHDLRHTCASSLVAGWWGRPWRLEEVRVYLGHGTIQMVERYAHLADSVLDEAVRSTQHLPTAAPAPITDSPAIPAAPPAGIGPATFGLGSQAGLRAISDSKARSRVDDRVDLVDLARRGLELVGKQAAGGVRTLIDLAKAVLYEAGGLERPESAGSAVGRRRP